MLGIMALAATLGALFPAYIWAVGGFPPTRRPGLAVAGWSPPRTPWYNSSPANFHRPACIIVFILLSVFGAASLAPLGLAGALFQ